MQVPTLFRASYAFFVVSLLSAASLPAYGQANTAMEGTLPDTIVVTASRFAEDQRLTGRRVTVWTARDIAAMPVASFDELLRTVGGVETQSRGGFGVQSDLTMRGSTFNGVLLLLDGARLNDPMTGHFLSDFPVPLSDIARIEVLRGPATALYGPDAIGGVIQVHTYAGLQDASLAPARLEGRAEIQGGAHDLYHLDMALQRTGRRAYVSAATTWQGSDGFAITNAEGQIVQRPTETIRTDFTRQAHSIALARPVGNTTIYGRLGYDDRDFGAYHFYTPFPSDTAREATTTYWAQLRLQNAAAAPTRWHVQLSAKQHDDTYIYNPLTPANTHTSSLLTLQSHATHTLHDGLVVGAGASASYFAIDSNNMGQHDDIAAGAFAMARWQPGTRLTLNASTRLDVDPGFGVEVTPQVSTAYNTDLLTLRAGVSRAVRAPNYIERYFNTTLARPRGRSLGNPDLKAERVWAYEAGVDVYPAQGLSMHATVFTRDTDNLIDYVKLTPADTVFLARNLLRVETTGLELDVNARRPLGLSVLHLTATYTLLDAVLHDIDQVDQFKYALTHARHSLQGTANLELGPVSVGVQGLWKERLDDTRYAVFNTRLAYTLHLGRQRMVLSNELRNVFDKQYAEVFDAPMPGRWWIFGVQVLR